MRPEADPDYIAFLLDAFARFEREGRSIRPFETWFPSLARKPSHSVIGAAISALRKRGPKSGLVAEFGVFKGGSINHIARLLPRLTIFGFDSFTGFPDDGRADWRHDFSVPEKPAVRDNVRLVEGMFSDTLPEFERGLAPGAKFDLIHIDCDIYSSTKTIFDVLKGRIDDGTIIVFDEVVNYNKFATHEILAFYRFLRETDLDFRWLVTVGRLRPLADYGTGPARRLFRDYRRMGWYQNAAVVVCRDPAAADRRAGFLEEARRLVALPEFRYAHSVRKPQKAA